ncbi:hypothetical protein J1614_008058 [Plenodomus biglobosus]|nr:hypothetical protein J1614_008058 [Plenodomus biglobosus]
MPSRYKEKFHTPAKPRLTCQTRGRRKSETIALQIWGSEAYVGGALASVAVDRGRAPAHARFVPDVQAHRPTKQVDEKKTLTTLRATLVGSPHLTSP